MNFLKRELAPITRAAWEEIEEEALNFLKIHLTGRRLVDVPEPKGLDYTAVPLGRLRITPPKKKGGKSGISYGVHQVKPLVEIRIPFELNIWELDNVERGAGDIDLDPVIDACRTLAGFEDGVIFNGLEQPLIDGLISDDTPRVELKNNVSDFLRVMDRVKRRIMDKGIEGPYTLAIHPDRWSDLMSSAAAYPLKKLATETVDNIVTTPAIDDAILVSCRGDDAVLTLGQDIAVGYQSHKEETVRLFLTESFTFHVYEPDAVQMLTFK